MNGHVLDIRKSNICTHLVNKEDQYKGPMLVKTELNYAGIPELVFLERPLKHIP
jgi:hypothetical protein